MPRFPMSALLMGLALLSAAACDRLPTESAAPTGAPATEPSFYTNATTICALQTIPSGYVILSAFGTTSCPYYSFTSPNAYNIAIPGDSERVCANSPIPTGYVIHGSERSSVCPNYSPTSVNVWYIKIPTEYYETVCYNSAIPSNYVLSYWTSSTACPGYPNNAKVIRRL